MKQFLNLWYEGFWYERVYLITTISFVFFGLLFLLLSYSYFNISNQIQSEYKALSKRHFFISLRTRKQRDLLKQAKYIVSSDFNYPFYVLAGIFGFISIISSSLALTFFVGSYVYENIINIPEIDNFQTDSSDDYIDIETDTVEYDDNIHHVDPHMVDGYERSDGTQVDGYWRGGEDGYDRSDPDGDLSNNLDGSDSSGEDYNSIGETVEEWGENMVESLFGN